MNSRPTADRIRTGRRPKRSERAPTRGEKRNCIRLQTVRRRPNIRAVWVTSPPASRSTGAGMSSARHGIIHRVFSRDFNRLVARYPEGHREIGAGRMRAGLPSAKLRDTKPIRRNGQTLSKYVRDGRAPVPRSPIISEVMSANRARNTQPELTLRRALRRLGVSGYRLHPSGLPGRPDLALPKARLAVFV